MAGLRLLVVGVSAFLLIGATALACTDCLPYSYSPPMYVLPVAPSYGYAPKAYCPCPSGPQMPYARPSPAPASPGAGTLDTHEPPLGVKPNKGPQIYQNRVFSGVPQTTEQRAPTCKVSFWNLSGFDVKLTVGDRNVAVAKDRAVILDLNRNFSWRTNFHETKLEDVADDLNHFEVMIR